MTLHMRVRSWYLRECNVKSNNQNSLIVLTGFGEIIQVYVKYFMDIIILSYHQLTQHRLPSRHANKLVYKLLFSF